MSLIKSSSSSTLPKLSVTKPPSPRRRARSKTRPDDPFLFNFTPELEDLETQIQSKRRTLELLGSQLPPIDPSLQDQILSRDRLIASLNRSILELKSSFMSQELMLKQKNWTNQIETLETQLEEYKKYKQEADTQFSTLKDQIKNLSQQSETDKSELVIMLEALKEENDQLKVLISARDTEILESDQNIRSLQGIIEKMNHLNSELYLKIEKKNNETEELNIKSYENMVKAKQTEELEKKISQYLQQKLELEHKISSLLSQIDNLSRFNSILEWSEKNLQILEEGVKKQQESLSHINPEQLENHILTLDFFFQELSNSLATIKLNITGNRPKVVEGLNNESNMRNLLKETQMELENNKEFVKSFKTRESALLEQISGFGMIIESNQVEFKNEILQMAKQSEMFNEQFSGFKARVKELLTENEVLRLENVEAKGKLTSLNGKYEKLCRKLKERVEWDNELKNTNKELKEKLSALMDDKKNTGKVGASEEMKMKKVIAHARILRDEVFRKDTEIVKMERDKAKYEAEIEALKGNIQKFQGKLKGIEASVLEKVNEELKEKDRQIEILKEMLRSAHCEIKTKDSKILTLQKKSEHPSQLSPRRFVN